MFVDTDFLSIIGEWPFLPHLGVVGGFFAGIVLLGAIVGPIFLGSSWLCLYFFTESLILAQDERWRRA